MTSDQRASLTTTGIDVDAIRRWISTFAELLSANTERLTQLDAAIGDADHGFNMERGATTMVELLHRSHAQTPGALLEELGQAVLDGIGGAAGPLYASLFLGAASVCADRSVLPVGQFADAIDNGVNALAKLGRAELGDKTMFDAARPAAAAMTEEGSELQNLERVVALAGSAAAAGRDATEPLQARKGRASYLGPRSIGHIDPGAASMTLLFEAMAAITDSEEL